MPVVECDIPMDSVLDRRTIEAAWYRDAWRAPLARPGAPMVDIFFGIFGHHPAWMKLALIVRNRLASWCGLDAPRASAITHPQRKSVYRVGDTIGVWPIFALSDTELVAGRDDKHLDFRLSILKSPHGEKSTVVVSTLCSVHNTFGKLYLRMVVPFHRWGVRRLLVAAIAAGRL